MAVLDIIATCSNCGQEMIDKEVCEQRYHHSHPTIACIDCGCMCDIVYYEGAGSMTAPTEVKAEKTFKGVEHYIILDFPEPHPDLHKRWPGATKEISAMTAQAMVLMSTKGSTDGRSLGGLSSVQVQLPGRVVTYKDFKTGSFYALIDPVVVSESETKSKSFEGCYSLPPKNWYTVERSTSMTVEHTTNEGRKHIELHWDAARFCKHEIDHLNGILISEIGVLRT